MLISAAAVAVFCTGFIVLMAIDAFVGGSWSACGVLFASPASYLL
jgi:hypothetical protein